MLEKKIHSFDLIQFSQYSVINQLSILNATTTLEKQVDDVQWSVLNNEREWSGVHPGSCMGISTMIEEPIGKVPIL